MDATGNVPIKQNKSNSGRKKMLFFLFVDPRLHIYITCV